MGLSYFDMAHKIGKDTKINIIVDDCDADLLEYYWYPNSFGYAQRSFGTAGVNRKQVFLHRIVLERKIARRLFANEVTDHIDGNKMDNRRSNLRAVTQNANQLNRHSVSRSKYGKLGVSKKGSKWRARIDFMGKHIILGYYNDIEDAAAAYQYAVEFARRFSI